jgi:hypothetical protein
MRSSIAGREQALARLDRPELCTADLGSPFTSAAFTATLAATPGAKHETLSVHDIKRDSLIFGKLEVR